MYLINKLWGFCNKLRHDGVDPADYIEQLTYLLFLKMAKEKGIIVPKGYDWESLAQKSNDDIINHLETIFKKLNLEPGILGEIYAEPVSRVKNPTILRELVKEIDNINWSDFDGDIVGLAFEELIGKVANEGKKGAGQYFTPRPLIQAIVNVIQPNPMETKNFNIGDVAVGTAGFLIVAYEWFRENFDLNKLDKHDKKRLVDNTYYGQELVQRPRRLALMNMFLHGINANITLGDTIYGTQNDNTFSCILSNPPFGSKGANQIPNRNFPVKTSDKQLNFIQHIIEKLKPNGRAAIVLPDSCLSSEAAKKIWSFYLDPKKKSKDQCNLHTILKLPDGVFAAYANGVKACVIFLEKGNKTNKIWMYDLRKDIKKLTTKSNVLTLNHFSDFIKSYGIDPNGKSQRNESQRFKSHSIEEVIERNFDISFVEVSQPKEYQMPDEIIDQMIADYRMKIIALEALKNNLNA